MRRVALGCDCSDQVRDLGRRHGGEVLFDRGFGLAAAAVTGLGGSFEIAAWCVPGREAPGSTRRCSS